MPVNGEEKGKHRVDYGVHSWALQDRAQARMPGLADILHVYVARASLGGNPGKEETTMEVKLIPSKMEVDFMVEDIYI